jgi:hypothetical protein
VSGDGERLTISNGQGHMIPEGCSEYLSDGSSNGTWWSYGDLSAINGTFSMISSDPKWGEDRWWEKQAVWWLDDPEFLEWRESKGYEEGEWWDYY